MRNMQHRMDTDQTLDLQNYTYTVLTSSDGKNNSRILLIIRAFPEVASDTIYIRTFELPTRQI